MKKTIIKTVVEEIEISPCIKCGNDDIRIYNCGYSSFNCAGGECKKCGHKVETHADWTATDEKLIKAWNRENDRGVVIGRLEKQRDEINKQIENLKL